MFGAGVDTRIDERLELIRLVAGGVAVERLDVRAAAAVVEQCAEAERILAALPVTAGARLEGAALWRREGFRSRGGVDGGQDRHRCRAGDRRARHGRAAGRIAGRPTGSTPSSTFSGP